ncbi:hypothetical protein [Kineococcus indalonis]|uniref:hypothetical protein n=1 Tax=Kineococcus indalonis TaxID=2696566 RepID=UPI001412491F|nr:hypothetical protein [Kineococcus indalonis]NAZ85499.1 hypothetical protein [Kineococcus indalonis]
MENETYLGNRLTYHEMEAKLDDRIALSDLTRALAVPAVGAVVVFVVSFLIGMARIYFQAASSLITGDAPSIFGLFFSSIFWAFFWSLIAFVILLLYCRADVPISEWSLVIDSKAKAAESAYTRIIQVLRDRRLPLDVEARRLSVRGHGVRNYLMLHQGKDTGYISVHPYGTGLFLGWMLWRRRNAASLVLTFIAQSFTYETPMDRFLRLNDTRAFREAVHNAVREGIDIADRDIDLPLQATLGHDVRIDVRHTPRRKAPRIVGQPVEPPAEAASPSAQR